MVTPVNILIKKKIKNLSPVQLSSNFFRRERFIVGVPTEQYTKLRSQFFEGVLIFSTVKNIDSTIKAMLI